MARHRLRAARRAALLLSLLPAAPAAAQGVATAAGDSAQWLARPIVRVELDGLRRTRPAVLRRELSCREGDSLDWDRLERDRLRLLDLDLFARVDLRADRDTAGAGPVLRVEVRERPTRYVLPNLEYDEEDGFTYGLFGAELNAGGRAWRGGFSSGWGGRRYLSVSAGAPWVAGRRLAAGAAFSRSRKTNRGEDQREDRTGGSALLAPTRGPHWSFPCDLGIEVVRARPVEHDTLRPARRDDHRRLGTGFRYDSRDAKARALRGSVLGLRAVGHGGLLGGSTSLVRYELDLLRTLPTGGGSALTLASRSSWSRGAVPRFLRLGLGGASTLRGHEISAYRGESRWFGWVEERFPLLAPREFRFAGGRETVDLTVEGDVFADAGSVWDGDALERGAARLRWGAGAGLRFLLPWVSVLQCDAATDGRRVRFHVLTGLRI